MPVGTSYQADPKILELGSAFYDEVQPADFPERTLRYRNDRAAKDVGLDTLSPEEWEAHFARFHRLPDNLEKPLALRYHGHQFGVYNAALGDGRGFLFAQLRDRHGRLLDLGTKGSGTTPWSRGGDGRLTLKGGVREVLATEMLEALGVKTSRTLSLFETGEHLHRGDEPSPTRSSVLVRLGHSHVRFGTFQRLAHIKIAKRESSDSVERGDPEAMTALVDYAIRIYFPELASTSGDERAVAFLDRVCASSATLAAEWMTAGFVHGVLNTDNMTITGDSFDYGPFRFAPTFDPDFTAAYFDHSGLYAFGKQPATVSWNLGRLADALRTIAPDAPLDGPLMAFDDRYEEALTDRTLMRLGVAARDPDGDRALATATWGFLATSKPKKGPIPFEQFFFDVYGGAARTGRAVSGPCADFYEGAAWTSLASMLARYEPRAPKSVADPYFQCDSPTTLRIDEIEAIWTRVAMKDDWSPLYAKVDEIRAMGAVLAPTFERRLL